MMDMPERMDRAMTLEANSFKAGSFFCVGCDDETPCEEKAEFSPHGCDICAPYMGSLAGARHCVVLMPPTGPYTGSSEPLHYSVCVDCFMFVANGIEA